MSSSLSPCIKTRIGRELAACGAFRAGFARAGDIDAAAAAGYARWIAARHHGAMGYLARHEPLRRSPESVLPGARTVISAAFPYAPHAGEGHPLVADYALGRDYHAVVRGRLERVAAFIRDNYGALCRVCCDTAPLPERYWAVRAGVGFTGLNHQLYVPGAGAGFFLGEIVTTLELAPDSPVVTGCTRCGACVRACPAGALGPDGEFDARLCLSYLTIEHRGNLPAGTDLHGRVYGCDACRKACPLTPHTPPEALPEFRPDAALLALDREAFATMTSGSYRRLFAHSAIRRAPLSQLRRNATAAAGAEGPECSQEGSAQSNAGGLDRAAEKQRRH